MPPTREPFPFPSYENGTTCKARSSKKTYGVPTQVAQDPWSRLHSTPTLASIRQEVWYTEPQGPARTIYFSQHTCIHQPVNPPIPPNQVSRDSLDFHLTALYNHHEDLLKDKSEVVLHKETICDDHGALKGLEPVKERGIPPIERPSSRGLSVRHWVNPVKESIHSIEGAIESPHTAATNSGFSRKENGGIFYH